MGGLILAIAGSTLNVLMVLLFNLISDLTGGLRVTMIEEEACVPLTSPPKTYSKAISIGRSLLTNEVILTSERYRRIPKVYKGPIAQLVERTLIRVRSLVQLN